MDASKHTPPQTLVSWLHEHPNRVIIIRAAGHRNEEGQWKPHERRAAIVCTHRVPDGRKVMTTVEVLDELMIEPEAGSHIVREVKIATERLLAGEAGNAER